MPIVSTIGINYQSEVSIPFTVNDTFGRLLGKRVTVAIGTRLTKDRLLAKASGLGSSSVDVEITQQTTTLVTGWAKLKATDFTSLPPGDYSVSLWVDDGATFEQCVTAGGSAPLTVYADVPLP